MAKESLKYTTGKINKSSNAIERANYTEHKKFWSEIIDQLEHGRQDIADHHLLESYIERAL